MIFLSGTVRPKSVAWLDRNTHYIYNDTLLTKKIKTKVVSNLIVSTGEKFKEESTVYRYDDSQRLITVLNYREIRLLDSTSVTYFGNTKTLSVFDSDNQVISIVKIKYDRLNREVERLYPELRKAKWQYDESDLLESVEYINLKTGKNKRIRFTYER